MPDEDQVTPEAESSEEGPLQTKDAEPQGEPETPAASSEGTAVVVEEPEVNYQEMYEQEKTARETAESAYDGWKGQAQQHEAELQRFRAAEAAAIKEIQDDRDKYVDVISDPKRGPAFFERLVAQKLQERDAVMQFKDTQIAGQQAANDLRDFAMKDAGMTDEEYAVFLHQNTDHTGVPFGSYAPDKALSIAKAVIRDKYHERFSQQVHESAAKAADAKAKLKLQKQAAPGASVGIQSEDKSPAQKWKDDVLGTESKDPTDAWIRE